MSFWENFTKFFIIIPTICIIGCYTAIYLTVRKSRIEISYLRTNSVSDRIKKKLEESNSQLFRMVLVVSVCYISLIIPKMVMGIITRKISTFSKVANIDRVLDGLVNANFVVNPFVYFFMNQNYREAFTQLLPEKLKTTTPKHRDGHVLPCHQAINKWSKEHYSQNW